MPKLSVTPARVELLRQVGAGEVYRVRRLLPGKPDQTVSETNDGRTVTAQCSAFHQVHWIIPGPSEGPSMYARKLWRLTAAGAAILTANPVPFVNPNVLPELTNGFVAGLCGHRVAGSEWRAGLLACEHCPNPVIIR